jgi:hypothetical protein
VYFVLWTLLDCLYTIIAGQLDIHGAIFHCCGRACKGVFLAEINVCSLGRGKLAGIAEVRGRSLHVSRYCFSVAYLVNVVLQ